MRELNATEDYLTLEPLRTRIEAHLLYSEQPEDVEQAVLDAIVLEPGDSLLDVGCGTGSFLRRLRSERHVGRLAGLETSPPAIEALHALEAVEAVQADAAAWSRTVLSRHGIDLSRPHGLPVHSGNLPDLMQAVFGNVETVLHINALVFPTADAFCRYAVAQLGLYGVGARFPTGRQSSTISWQRPTAGFSATAARSATRRATRSRLPAPDDEPLFCSSGSHFQLEP